MPEDDILKKIANALALAERGATEEERDNAMAHAQRLSTRYQIDLQTARQFTEKAEKREEATLTRVDIGEPGNRGGGAYAALFWEIAELNDLKLIVANSGAWADCYGFPSDVKATYALYAVLVVQMVQACEDYLDRGEWRDEGVTKANARKSFYTGFTNKVTQRLKSAKYEAEALARKEYATQGVSTELVMKDKRREVSDIYRNRTSGWSRKAWTIDRGNSRSGRGAGTVAGERARLFRQNEVDGGKRAIG